MVGVYCMCGEALCLGMLVQYYVCGLIFIFVYMSAELCASTVCTVLLIYQSEMFSFV